MNDIDFDNLTDDQLDRLVNDFKTINKNMEEEGYSPLELSLFEQIGNLKKENLRLTKKLEYCYEKMYLILNNLDDKNDVLKLWDAVEEFKTIQKH